MEEERAYHVPVLLNESIDALNIQPDGVYVDLTFGGGGHSRKILEQLGESGKLIAFDQDEDAEANAKALDDPRLIFVAANFRYCQRYLRLHGFKQVNGILGDLGVSSHQFDEGERGFTFRTNSSLDMRMGKQTELTAGKVLNEYDEKDLMEIFRQYGEIRSAYKLAQRIVQERALQPLQDSDQLKAILEQFAPKGKEHKFFAQAFQALRIEVNDELGALKEMLLQTAGIVGESGRVAIISYHSLEDRLVKNYFRSGNFEDALEKDFYGNPIRPFKPVQGKAIKPTNEEIFTNNRARSARLRVAAKTNTKI